MIIWLLLTFVLSIHSISEEELKHWLNNFNAKLDRFHFPTILKQPEFGSFFATNLASFPTTYTKFYQFLVENDAEYLKDLLTVQEKVIKSIPFDEIIKFNSPYWIQHWLTERERFPIKVARLLSFLDYSHRDGLAVKDSVVKLQTDADFNPDGQSWISRLIIELVSDAKKPQLRHGKEFANTLASIIFESSLIKCDLWDLYLDKDKTLFVNFFLPTPDFDSFWDEMANVNHDDIRNIVYKLKSQPNKLQWLIFHFPQCAGKIFATVVDMKDNDLIGGIKSRLQQTFYTLYKWPTKGNFDLPIAEIQLSYLNANPTVMIDAQVEQVLQSDGTIKERAGVKDSNVMFGLLLLFISSVDELEVFLKDLIALNDSALFSRLFHLLAKHSGFVLLIIFDILRRTVDDWTFIRVWYVLIVELRERIQDLSSDSNLKESVMLLINHQIRQRLLALSLHDVYKKDNESNSSLYPYQLRSSPDGGKIASQPPGIAHHWENRTGFAFPEHAKIESLPAIIDCDSRIEKYLFPNAFRSKFVIASAILLAIFSIAIIHRIVVVYSNWRRQRREKHKTF